jgi:hypothetical protein
MEETMKQHSKLAVVALAIASFTLPALAGKVSYSDLSIAAAPKSTEDKKHKETIDISSWSLGASNSTAATGNTTVAGGILQFTASSIPASAARLCQSHAVLPSLTIEADGKRAEFIDVAFKDCPAGGRGTFTLTFQGQTTAPAPRAIADIANATISGMTRMSCSNNLKQIGIATHSATIYVGSANGGVWKTTDGGVPAAGTQFPSVVIEGKGGTKIEFKKVMLKQVTERAGLQVITIDFESTTATQQLADAIVAGR